MTIWLGVDPGTQTGAKAGGIALLSPKYSQVWPMPSMKLSHGRGTDHAGLMKVVEELLDCRICGEHSAIDRSGYLATIEQPLLFMRQGGNKLWENYGCAKQCLTDHYIQVQDISPNDWQKVIFGKTFQQMSRLAGKKIFEKQYPGIIHAEARCRLMINGTDGDDADEDLRTSHGKVHTGIACAILIAEAGRLLHEKQG